ncbi:MULTISPECIES: M20 metallopeptidase family protein [Bifidobacterium]|jgi:amidohydrolase|uniref:M20/M25/M40 family metallo-hydrolase n=1 Tax=Bifidobacterium fermentum TaxID=3059035 RepID=A0AB39UHK7_9BIFI|nr:M20/M25/M40 family metallo-hydrolase [Bifidobacterium psychraerophilum]
MTVQGPLGSILLREGSTTGAVDKFQVTINGRGTHAASPQHGADPVVATTAIIQSLQSVVGRNLDPVLPRVLSVTHIDAGTTWNAIPQSAFFEGTVRTALADDRTLAKTVAERLIHDIAAAYGTTAEINWFFGSPAVINDEHWTQVAEKVVSNLGLKHIKPDPGIGGEDFSYYLQKAPGVFAHIGAGDAGAGHSPQFAPDPAGIHYGVAFLTSIALAALDELHD